MKKNFISVALFVVLATMAVSCQKEDFDVIRLLAEETSKLV